MHPVSHVKYIVILKLAMALRKYFRSTTSSRTEPSSGATESEPSTEHSHDDDYAPGPSKRVCTEFNRKYKKWEKSFQWLHYDEDIDFQHEQLSQRMIFVE